MANDPKAKAFSLTVNYLQDIQGTFSSELATEFNWQRPWMALNRAAAQWYVSLSKCSPAKSIKVYPCFL